ncbi:MAG: glycoside hydrolase family 88 protein [Bacteroides sp.]|nr:glycoside hydrolase family 88 protein [Bacteroides sp.]
MFPVIIHAQATRLGDFPEGYTPKEIGGKLSNRFIELNKHVLYRGKYINYQEVCVYMGALKYAQLTQNAKLTGQLKDRFETFFTTEKHLVPTPFHVDLTVFGSVPLELYRITGEQRYYEMGMPFADEQWILPAEATDEEKAWADKGFSWQTRLWIDDMYMITVIQSQAYKVTGDLSYIDRAAREMVVYLDELQRPNGLFYHAPDVPFFWGRGNGWMAAGMTELLSILPEDNPDRPRIMKGYLTMMKSLKDYQTPSGMWNQLVDDPECWAETSGSAMFAYAMITGVKRGWLRAEEYDKVARKAWMSLVKYINEDGDITDVCVGTNKENSRQYYYDRSRQTGDYHGQAAMLWCACALLEK